MQKDRQEQDNENSLRSRSRQLRTKQSKKSTQSRDLTHYFTRIQKPASSSQSIITPIDSSAADEIEDKIAGVEERKAEMREKIAEMKVRLQGQKEGYDSFVARVRAVAAEELKTIAQIDRFSRGQKKRELLTKCSIAQELESQIEDVKRSMNSETLSQGQKYFLYKGLKTKEGLFQAIQKEKNALKQEVRLFQEEQGCILARQGWSLLAKKYQPLSLLGKGGFSQVYQAYNLDSSSLVAVKLSSVQHLLVNAQNRQEYLRHIKREYQTHKNLLHPNIVRMIEVFELQTSICIVLQYCEGNTLAHYLNENGPLPEHEVVLIVRQLVDVLCYLSSQTPVVIHYDLKPQNIMFHKGIIKVLDFGICKTMDSEHSKMALTSQGVGSYWYLPPETFKSHNPTVSSKVDIWSLGVICYEMLHGIKPFSQVGSKKGIITQSGAMGELQFGESISQAAADFLRRCLEVDERQRIDPSTANNHSFIRQQNSLQMMQIE